MALSRLQTKWDISAAQVPFFYLDLIQFRAISDEIAVRFQVVHESPQLLLIRNGKCVFNQTHSAISVEDVKTFLAG